MRIYLHSLQTTLRGLAVPFVAALLMCWLALLALPHREGTGADRIAGQWLHLPGLLLGAAGLGAVLENWPPFSRDRDGSNWILRVTGRPLHGCLVAALGNLTGLALALATIGLLFYGLLAACGFDQGVIRTSVRFHRAGDQAVLNNGLPSLSFEARNDEPVSTIRLRPQAVYAKDFSPARMRVLADGRPLHEGWRDNFGRDVTLQVTPPRPIARLTVERQAGLGVGLLFDANSVEGVTPQTRAGILNCVLASTTYLAPLILALAVMIVGHAHLALPVNLAAGIVTLLLATLLEVTPNGAAITAFARGRWLGTEDVWRSLPSIGAAVAVLVALRWGLGRMNRG